MASLSSIDKLNNLQTKVDKKKIEKYFEEMDLDYGEIEERISLANDIDDMYLRLFLLITATLAIGETFDSEYYKDYLTRNYYDILDGHGYDTSQDYIGGYVEMISDEVIRTTEEKLAQEYYLSNDRAVEIACNDANAVGNYNEHVRMIKAGYTRKRWVTLLDRKVRCTHQKADGQEVDIQMPFKVGNSELLFPLDTSLNAELKEIINCRCVAKYFDKQIGSGEDIVYPITEKSIQNVSSPLIENEDFSQEWLTAESEDVLRYAKDSNNSFETAKLYSDKLINYAIVKGNQSIIEFSPNEIAKAFAIIHNHPNNKTFSMLDLTTFFDAEKLKYFGLVKNNGTIELIAKTNFNISIAYTEMKRLKKKYQNIIANDKTKGYDLVVDKFLKTTKSGIQYFR